MSEIPTKLGKNGNGQHLLSKTAPWKRSPSSVKMVWLGLEEEEDTNI
jgi:hypothetical protein